MAIGAEEDRDEAVLEVRAEVIPEADLTVVRAEDPDLEAVLREEADPDSEVAVAVGDTTGELQKFTQLADLVFTGKSLAPHEGGQTPVEAAILEAAERAKREGIALAGRSIV